MPESKFIDFFDLLRIYGAGRQSTRGLTLSASGLRYCAGAAKICGRTCWALGVRIRNAIRKLLWNLITRLQQACERCAQSWPAPPFAVHHAAIESQNVFFRGMCHPPIFQNKIGSPNRATLSLKNFQAFKS